VTHVASFFVTGTDTGVGKTFVACGILAALRRRGVPVAALKPAETGCARSDDGVLLPDDGTRLRAAAGLEDVPLEIIVPHRYALPAAPAVAGRVENVTFSLPRVEKCRATLLARNPRLLIVEGAGGLLVPYLDELYAADVILALQLPILVIARAGLGTINHTLLTLAEARRRGIAVRGVILSRVVEAWHPSEESNAHEIARLGGVPVLGTVPHLPAAARDDLLHVADVVESVIDVERLLAA
jgi:dethiobiotin synthetase